MSQQNRMIEKCDDKKEIIKCIFNILKLQWNSITVPLMPKGRLKCQKHPPEVFCEKDAPKNFANFKGQHLCWSLFLIKLQVCNFIKERHQHRYFPVEFAKFLTSLLKICERLFFSKPSESVIYNILIYLDK